MRFQPTPDQLQFLIQNRLVTASELFFSGSLAGGSPAGGSLAGGTPAGGTPAGDVSSPYAPPYETSQTAPFVATPRAGMAPTNLFGNPHPSTLTPTSHRPHSAPLHKVARGFFTPAKDTNTEQTYGMPTGGKIVRRTKPRAQNPPAFFDDEFLPLGAVVFLPVGGVVFLVSLRVGGAVVSFRVGAAVGAVAVLET
mmetsp:Transcript_22026/g.61220  ORF Transcript_22026/g.61220 Transcript_22026/m.61220 type:complete len:195 (-) Transcript_22026:833-1417(-)